MNYEPLVSVKILTYNHERYISKAIEGVLSQKTEYPFELVIGEDCSTDGTRQIVFDYQRNYPDIIRVLTSDTNVRAHRNSLRTDRACRGKYIAFCEGDDYWHSPDKLQKQVTFLESNPDYGMVHSNVDVQIVESGELLRSHLNLPADLDDAGAYVEILSDRRRVYTVTACVSKALLLEVLRENPECTDGRFPMGDLQRWLELSRVGKVKYMPESLATYCVLPESASNNSRHREKILRFDIQASVATYHYLEKYPLPPDKELQVRGVCALKVLRSAIYADDVDIVLRSMEDVISLGLLEALSLRERLIVWGCRSPIRRMLVAILKSFWNVKKNIGARIGSHKNY